MYVMCCAVIYDGIEREISRKKRDQTKKKSGKERRKRKREREQLGDKVCLFDN